MARRHKRWKTAVDLEALRPPLTETRLLEEVLPLLETTPKDGGKSFVLVLSRHTAPRVELCGRGQRLHRRATVTEDSFHPLYMAVRLNLDGVLLARCLVMPGEPR